MTQGERTGDGAVYSVEAGTTELDSIASAFLVRLE